MHPDPPPKNPNIPRTHNQIPQKVPTRQPLYQPARTRIPIYPLNHTLPHLTPLFIVKHNIQRQCIDQTALHHRHDVYIPVYARAFVEVAVDVWEEEVGYQRGYDGLGGLVEDEGEEDFVDVVW